MLELLLFSLYVAPVSNIAVAHHVSIHQYADDIQTYIAIQPQCPDSLSQLVNCTDDITHWFLENDLLLNPSKVEAVVFGTASRLRSADTTGGVKVAGTSLQFSDTVKLLGVELDQALSILWTGMYPASSVPATFISAHCATSVHVSH